MTLVSFKHDFRQFWGENEGGLQGYLKTILKQKKCALIGNDWEEAIENAADALARLAGECGKEVCKTAFYS